VSLAASLGEGFDASLNAEELQDRRLEQEVFLRALHATAADFASFSPVEQRILLELQRALTSRLSDCIIAWSDADAASEADAAALLQETEFILSATLACVTGFIHGSCAVTRS
jgi:hypothetical protein